MFKFLNKKNKSEKKKVELEFTNNPIPLNLSKEASLDLLNLRKDTVSNICSSIPDLKNMKARVSLVLDFSGSMRDMFTDGTVQAAIERLMPIANQFDDDGEMDLWIFENGYKRLDAININNFYGIAKKIYEENRMGGTNYSPVMNDVINKYTKEDRSYLPAYIFFLTDGDNFDKKETENLIKKTCKEPIFWQFVGLGTASMSFLENLDDMEGREIDNVDFFRLSKPNNVTDKSLYEKCFDEYPEWVRTVRNKGIIR